MNIWFGLAAFITLLTLLVHSFLGEQRLIKPVLASEVGVMKRPLARQVTRFAWHWTSLLWLIPVFVLAQAAFDPQSANMLLLLMIAMVHVGRWRF